MNTSIKPAEKPLAGGPELPSISIVIETVNDEEGPVLELNQVLAGLAAQTYPQDKIAILVVVDAANHDLKAQLNDKHPQVEICETENSTYYAMKIAGIERARGDIIALLDSDTLPVPTWAEMIAQSIASGADVVAGKTRYVEGSSFAQTFNFFNFGYIEADENGVSGFFIPNNAAFRREVIQAHNFDPRIRRGGAGHLLSGKLTALGVRLVYNPGMRVFHNAYGLGVELNMRLKVGYDSVNLSQMDADQVLEETNIIQKNSIFGLLLIWARRIVFDARIAVKNRQDLDIRIYQIPYFVLISPVVRTLELAAALITLATPKFFQDRYDW